MIVGLSYLTGSVPVSNLAARALRGVDLRQVENGTVSGTSLYRVAGFPALAAAGCLEIAKGALAPALARHSESLSAAAAAAAVTGHNWSVFLGGAGGRGLSPAVGSLLLTAPEGAALVLGGMAAGRLVRQTAVGSILSVLALPILLGRTRGASGRRTAIALALPIVAKRLAGNGAPAPSCRSYLVRLLRDRP